jgi:hypothetical protein
MEAETILVLLLTAIFVGFVVGLAIHTRRERSVAKAAGASASPLVAAPRPEVQRPEEMAKTKRRGE